MIGETGGKEMPLQFMRDEKLEPEAVATVQECLQNMDWFNAHSAEISEQFKGKYVAVAGGKVFAADSYKAAYDLATFQEGSRGPFVLYIPLVERKMIYDC
jgi:hypothetical protein